MTDNKRSKQVLSDHKRVGKRLIPPMMQLDKLVETSFQSDTLPELVWISSIFLQSSDRDAVDIVTEFLRISVIAINDEAAPTLAYLGNFNRLSDEHRNSILSATERVGLLPILREKLNHQFLLLKRYPLAFLFGKPADGNNEKLEIDKLKSDVESLLDRYSHHASKVQTTAVVSMMVTGKMFISSTIECPDFDAVIRFPDSPEGKRAASFVRASLNGGAGFYSEDKSKHLWARDFWGQVFRLGACE